MVWSIDAEGWQPQPDQVLGIWGHPMLQLDHSPTHHLMAGCSAAAMAPIVVSLSIFCSLIPRSVADQFAHAPIGESADGMTCYRTWRVIACRPSAYSGGACTN